MALLALVITGAGCTESPPHDEKTGTIAYADTALPIFLCAAWQPYSATTRSCDVTVDVSAVLAKGKAMAGAQASTLKVYPQVDADAHMAASPATVRAWFDVAGRVVEFLKATKQPIDLRERSLAAIADQKAQLVAAQSRLETERKTAIDAIVGELRPKLEAALAPENAAAAKALADARLTIAEAQVAIGQARAALTGLAPRFTQITTDFKALKATEAAVMTELNAISSAASAASVSELPAVELRVKTLFETETARLSTFSIEAVRLRSEASVARAHFERLIERDRAFFEATGVRVPEIADAATRSLGNMASYCDLRRDAFATAASRLLEGIRARREALVSQNVSQATRETIEQGAMLKASQEFLDQATAHALVESTLPPKSERLKLPLLSEKYDRLQQIIQLEESCAVANQAPTSWMQAGCISLARTIGKARAFVQIGVPPTIRIALPVLRREGVAPALIADIEAHLAAGRTRQAIASYDVAVRSTEAAR
jgi:hypothetical protein